MKRWKLIAVYVLLFLFAEKSRAQRPVEKEPHHRVVLENDYLRLLEGKVKPGDTTLPHRHDAESLVIFLSTSTFGIGIAGEKPVLTKVKPGDLRYVAYGTKPVTHTVWNQSKGIFHFLVVELKRKAIGTDTCRTLSLPGVKPVLLQKGLAVYRLQQPIPIPKSSCAYLLVQVSTGRFAYFPPQHGLTIKDHRKGGAPAMLVALQ